MSDRCVHRRFPLSQAPTRLVGDQVICGYHGFTYGADGPDMEPLAARFELLVDNLLDLSAPARRGP